MRAQTPGAARWLVCFWLAFGPGVLVGSGAVLTRATEVLSLTAAQARQHLSVSITGVVTVAEAEWDGRFFVQDSSGGVFVNNTNGAGPVPGDLVHVEGLSHPGGYAPCITLPHWTRLGTAPLPEPEPISVEQLMLGTPDGQRVEVRAIVRSAQAGSSKLALELAAGGYRFKAFPPVDREHPLDPASLVGARVWLRGTAAASFNAPLRQILTMAMFIPSSSDFIVDETPAQAMAQEPFTPLNAIAQYRQNATPTTRIRVQGVVTYQRPGTDLFLQDGSGGLQVKSRDTNRFAPGAVVEAVGFPGVESFHPVLLDASLRQSPERREPIQPREAPFKELLQGRHHSEFVTLRGKLLDNSFRGGGPTPPPVSNGLRRVLTLQNSDLLFTAEAPWADDARLAGLPLGSTLKVSGICVQQAGAEGRMDSLHLLLPDPADIVILQQPGWWTPQRLLVGAGALLAGLVLAVTWTLLILQRNAALRASIEQKEKAQRELQEAHDLLETRVQERTNELKVEMSARKEAEVRFKATLAERTRLAQELHDTLEQSMTGIGLQLDAAGELFRPQPPRGGQHVELARGLLTQCQVELRRSIWDLRSRALEEFDLCSALLESGRRMTEGTGIQLRVLTEGEVRPLPEVVEENLLRIGQEALTNLVKHANATTATLTLQFEPQRVVLSVRDDGRGFTPEASAGPQEGHFGLAGIEERTKRLGGRLAIESVPGAGACVRVEIPTTPDLAAEPLAHWDL